MNYKKYGVDISKHNGTIDWKELKKNNDFVIIRIGYSNTLDPLFKQNYAKAKEHGLKVGGYWYSYALTKNEALIESKFCYEIIKGLRFEYPIFYDMEDADGYKKKHGMPINKELCTICEEFCEYLENLGYYVGVYASESWFKNQLKNLSDKYDKWVANWGTNNGKLQNDKSSNYHLHQFTSNYKLNGKVFDRNVSYLDYASIMKKKGLNGFAKTSSTMQNNATKSTNKTTDIKVGSKVKFNGSATKYATGQKIPTWVKARSHTVKQLSSDKTKALLKEINSWVYVKDIKVV